MTFCRIMSVVTIAPIVRESIFYRFFLKIYKISPNYHRDLKMGKIVHIGFRLRITSSDSDFFHFFHINNKNLTYNYFK